MFHVLAYLMCSMLDHTNNNNNIITKTHQKITQKKIKLAGKHRENELNWPFSIYRKRRGPVWRSRYSRRRVLKVTPRWNSFSHHPKSTLHIKKWKWKKNPDNRNIQNTKIFTKQNPKVHKPIHSFNLRHRITKEKDKLTRWNQ